MKIRPLYLFIIFLLVWIAGELIYTRLILYAERNTYLMDTPVKVQVYGSNAPALSKAAIKKIAWLEDLFSKYKPKSDVRLINQLAGQAPYQTDPETYDCIELSQQMADLTDDAFDITLGKPRALELLRLTRKVYLKDPEASINLGAIGKGFAVEAARQQLLKSGARSGMIDMRSSVAVFGEKVWRIGVQHPRKKDALLGLVELENGQSLATSGDYERGKHIIDPRTGEPALSCQSVTIIGNNAAETDALATAVFVMGANRGLRLIELLPDVEALVIDREGKIFWSSGFELIEL